ELNVSLAVASLLVSRGYPDAESAYKFLNPSLSDLSDFRLLPDLEPAVRRLACAVERKEPVLVYGDYDVDGVSSTALWITTLRRLGVPAEPFVPHREREGYDLNAESALREARQIGAKLVLTCDCGIRAHQAVEAIQSEGIEVLVTDHHEPGDTLPPASAVVNPKRSDSDYPFRELCGAGVAYRVAEALLNELRVPRNGFQRRMLELVALGTVADVAPLVGENRVLVKYGLEYLQQTKWLGINALKTVSGIGKRVLNTRDIGFGLAPRLNAVGRLEDAVLALQLLLSECKNHAAEIAQQLDLHNRTRRDIQEEAVQEAIAQVEAEELTRHRALVVRSEGWHHGIVGLVASKLVNHYHRPAFVATLNHQEGVARGSIRSIPAYDLKPVLALMKPLCIKCGGHALAGGFAVALERFEELRQVILNHADQTLTDEDLIPALEVDLEVEGSEVNARLLSELQMLEPFGVGNEKPLMLCREVEVLGSRTSRDGKHLFLRLRPDGSPVIDGVLWNGGDRPAESASRLNLLFRPEYDTYKGYNGIRWVIEDFEACE
ncbi:MAG: single-stranded-DNA-specific exonuclease RecJ, partial [Fimbriimonadales bacterium]